jgi:hypothetical protein
MSLSEKIDYIIKNFDDEEDIYILTLAVINDFWEKYNAQNIRAN